MKKLIRTTTIPITFKEILSGQLKYVAENSDFEVIAIAAGGEIFDKVLEDNGVRGYPVAFTRKTFSIGDDLKAFFQLIKIFRKEKPYIIHSQGSKDALLCMLAGWIARVPNRVYTIAGLGDLPGIRGKMLTLAEWVTFAFATKLYPNSKKMNEIYLSRHMYSRKKALVIKEGSSNGCDMDLFNIDVLDNDQISSIKKDYNLSNDSYNFVFVGRIVGDKGVNEMIKAFKRLSAERDCRLVIVGRFEKDLYQDIEEECYYEIENNPYIKLTGYQNDVRPFIAACDTLLLPSYREGMPNVVMQASALNRTAIVTDINGCNEIVTDGINGNIIPARNTEALYEKMKYYCDHREEIKAMSLKSRELVNKKYNKKDFLAALVEEYNKL